MGYQFICPLWRSGLEKDWGQVNCADGGFRAYLEGHGDLVSRQRSPISHVTTPIIPIILNYLLSLHDPPSRVVCLKVLCPQ